MRAWTVVWRKSNRHKWNLICTTPDPLHRDVLVINELHKFKGIDEASNWQVGYLYVDDFKGGEVVCMYPQNATTGSRLITSDELPEPLPLIESMMNCNYNYQTARYELVQKGFDYATDRAIEKGNA